MSSQRATISDVARQAGVSISTVSRVLNDTVPVDAETAERVRAAVADLNYYPHSAARTLASKKTNTIGLLLADIGGEFYTPMLRGIEVVASQAGFDLLIHSTRLGQNSHTNRHPLGEHNTDGLLVFTDAVNENELVRLQNIEFPVVILHQSSPRELKIPSITIENRQGAQKIVEHLIEVHGCRRIVCMRGPESNEDSQERLKGYRNALKNHDIPFDPCLVVTGGFESEQASRSMQQLAGSGIQFDAVFSGDDDNAVGVLQALRQQGRQVPQDIPVVGFDDSLFARVLNPPLTTVRAPVEQVGREGARQLIALIRGEPAEQKVTLPVELVIRQSCGCRG